MAGVGGRGGLIASRGALWAAVLVVVLVRLPFLTAPLTSDEGGFLVVAGQWGPGDSLYGDYWVDRPPLLITVFALADLLGGTVALRLIGCVAAVATVVLAHALGRRIGGPRGAVWATWAAAGFISTPLFDARQVSGELLAVPFVLAGVLALLTGAARPRGVERVLLLAAAGGAGAAAVLVKQSFFDVFVFVAAYVLALELRRGRGRGRGLVPWVGAGAVLVTAVVLGGAAARGTGPLELWDAVVTFRAEAASVIASSASIDTPVRLLRYPLILALSGALVVGGALVLRVYRRRGSEPIADATLALLAWEMLAVLGGGSYWLHYLVGLVPGLVLATALLTPEPGRAAALGRVGAAWAVTLAVAANLVQMVVPHTPSPAEAAATWLSAYSEPGDTVVVAYGQPNILAESGTTSPYADLWSLPVRVRDPELTRMTRLFRSPDAPDWVLVWGTLDSWGIDPVHAEAAMRPRYEEVASVCGFVVYLHREVRRTAGPGVPDTECD